MKNIIRQILKEDKRQMYLDKIINFMRNDFPLFKNIKNYVFYDQLSKDELNYVLSGVFGRNVEIVPSYYTQILNEFGNLLYLEVEDGCLEGTFVNYLEDINNIDSTEDMYDCVWNEASDIMDYIGGFFDIDFEPLSLDEFLVEYSDILNRTMKNDIMFLLSEL